MSTTNSIRPAILLGNQTVAAATPEVLDVPKCQRVTLVVNLAAALTVEESNDGVTWTPIPLSDQVTGDVIIYVDSRRKKIRLTSPSQFLVTALADYCREEVPSAFAEVKISSCADSTQDGDVGNDQCVVADLTTCTHGSSISIQGGATTDPNTIYNFFDADDLAQLNTDLDALYEDFVSATVVANQLQIKTVAGSIAAPLGMDCYQEYLAKLTRDCNGPDDITLYVDGVAGPTIDTTGDSESVILGELQTGYPDLNIQSFAQGVEGIQPIWELKYLTDGSTNVITDATVNCVAAVVTVNIDSIDQAADTFDATITIANQGVRIMKLGAFFVDAQGNVTAANENGQDAVAGTITITFPGTVDLQNVLGESVVVGVYDRVVTEPSVDNYAQDEDDQA